LYCLGLWAIAASLIFRRTGYGVWYAEHKGGVLLAFVGVCFAISFALILFCCCGLQGLAGTTSTFFSKLGGVALEVLQVQIRLALV
jgi:hypothetical protein